MDSRLDVAIVTCSLYPNLAEEETPLLGALRDLGLSARPVVWDDASFDWSEAKVAVVRSTWDYVERRDAFVAWADRAAASTRLFNSAKVIRWNTHKGYLRDLEARGVGIVPTEFVSERSLTNGEVDVSKRIAARGWSEVVVKPAISCGARNTKRLTKEDALAHAMAIASLGENVDVMVQPYVRCVEGHGERSIIVIDGKPTHAMRKQSAFEATGIPGATRVDLSTEESELARGVVRIAHDFLGETLLYARVDLVWSDSNEPLLMELEVVEPSLFLSDAPHAAHALARAIQRRIFASQHESVSA